jgi:DNA-binding transcriptional regulator of glucitol operon
VAAPVRLWWTRRAVAYHVVLAVALPAFAAAFWWQIQRVRSGNTLSWAYVFEWPFFAGYAVYLWWKLVHDQEPAPSGGPGPVPPAVQDASAPDPEVDGAAEDADDADSELAAYNRYLAELDATGGATKRWRH